MDYMYRMSSDDSNLLHPTTEISANPNLLQRVNKNIVFTDLDNSLIKVIRSTVTEADGVFAQSLAGPHARIILPDTNSDITKTPGDSYFGIHLLSLSLGLRFPLHPLLVEILEHYHLVPGQLVPNSHLMITAFIARCHSVNERPTLDLFNFMFQVGRSPTTEGGFVSISGRQGFRIFKDLATSHKQWKTKFVFVSLGAPLPFRNEWINCFRRYNAPDSTPDLEIRSQNLLRGSPLKIDDFVTEENLSVLGFIRGPPLSDLPPEPTPTPKPTEGTAKRTSRREIFRKMMKSSWEQPPWKKQNTSTREVASPRAHQQQDGGELNLVRLGLDIPCTASVLKGEVSARELCQSLIPPCDLADPEPTSDEFFHAQVQATLKATLLLCRYERLYSTVCEEAQAFRARAMELEMQLANMVAAHEKEKEFLKEKHVTELAEAVERYKGSGDFKADLNAHVQDNIEEIMNDWLTTEAGVQKMADENILSFHIGQYDMQQEIYAVLRHRDNTFSPSDWDLPAEMEDPDPDPDTLLLFSPPPVRI